MNREDELVREWFGRHHPPVGERLPPERVLAETLGVSRAALRKGLAALEERGLLLRQVGRGTFVQAAPGLTVASARFDEAPVDASPQEALAARLALEPPLAQMAARDGNRAAFQAIEQAELGVASARDWPTYDAADEAFHRSIAQASGNPVLVRLFEETAAAARAVAWGGLRQRGDVDPADASGPVRDHAAIRTAILARDVHGAGDAMRRHLLVETSGLVGIMV